MSDIYKINIDSLKSYENDFKTELNNFNNKTYTTFSSSYLKSCSDSYVQKMSNELTKLYEKVKIGYQNIDKWWVDYNNNIEQLENYLSGNGNIGAISENGIRNAAYQLPELKKYDIKFSGVIASTITTQNYSNIFSNNTVVSAIDPFSSLYSDYNVFKVNTKSANNPTWFEKVGCCVENGVKSLWSNVTNWWEDVSNWWDSKASPWIEKAASTVWDVVKSVGATVAVFVQSLVEGVLQFAEAIIDFVALVGTGVASIVTGLIDGGQAIYGAITGNEWSSVTKKMWGGTMGFVSTQYVSGWFDALYQNTAYGKWLATNAYGFDTTRSIGSGIGYIAGVVVLTIATLGAGSVVAASGSVTASTAVAATTTTQMAITATAAGIGRGTQNAWADGASLGEGLTVGTLTGLWEGFQFYLGGKISKVNLLGSNGLITASKLGGVPTKFVNSLTRVILDGVDGGAEGFVIPFLNSLYKDGYYDENGTYVKFNINDNAIDRYSKMFNDNGGWNSVLTQTVTGSATSVLGESFDLRRYFKDTKLASADNMDDAFLEKYNIRDGFFGGDQNATRKFKSYQINNSNWILDTNDFYSFLRNKGYDHNTAKQYLNTINNPCRINMNVRDLVIEYMNGISDYNQLMKQMDAFSNNVQQVLAPEYIRLRDKLTSLGMNIQDATKTMDAINTTGVCTYAATANTIMSKFKNNPQKFKQIFGFDMFTTINGKKVLNTSELILDMYTEINSKWIGSNNFIGETLFLKDTNTNVLSINKLDTNNQFYLSDFSMGDQTRVIDDYLKSKDMSLNYASSTNVHLSNQNFSIQDLQSEIIDNLKDGKQIKLDVGWSKGNDFEFKTVKGQLDATLKPGQGHAVFVTGVNKNGVIISSWGQKYIIDWNNFQNNSYHLTISDIGGI